MSDPVRAVVFDWAGTIVDFGSRAPMGAFVEAFRRFGVDITIAEARGPMGLAKRDHIRALGTLPRVEAAWRSVQGGPFDDAAIDRIYEVFVPLNAEVVTEFADFIPGALDTVAELRRRGIRIGSTTGYTREIMARLLPVAAAGGYSPDNLVCAGDLAAGRPSPLMMYRTFADLGVWPASTCVKVDDTEPGIGEGVAVGCWTVGLALSGNMAGLSRAELAGLSPRQVAALRTAAADSLVDAGADYVIDSVADLLPVIDEIGERILAGDRPDRD